MKQEEGPSQEQPAEKCEVCHGRGELTIHVQTDRATGGWDAHEERHPCWLCQTRRRPVVES